MFLAIFAISFGVVLGVKAYNSNVTSQLLETNLKALNQDGEPIPEGGELHMYCHMLESWQSTCMASCPVCGTMWEGIHKGYGARLTGICPRCTYHFPDN